MQSFLQHRRIGRQVANQLEAKKSHHSDPENDVEAQTGREGHRPSTRSSATRLGSDAGRDEPKAKASEKSDGDEHSQNMERMDNANEAAAAQREELERAPTARQQDASNPQHEASQPTRPSARPQSSSARRSFGTNMGMALTGVDVRDRSTNEGGGDEQVFVVGWEGSDDPSDPHNWPNWKRWYVTVLVAAIGAVVGIASAIDSSALMPASREFHVSEVAESLATVSADTSFLSRRDADGHQGLYLIGFGSGALFAGPFSETVGRNPVYIVTLSLFSVFIMASGLAPNYGAQLIFRFLAGFFGATPLVVAGGSISDIWNPLERGMTLSFKYKLV
jgi:hypothetical protein